MSIRNNCKTLEMIWDLPICFRSKIKITKKLNEKKRRIKTDEKG